MEPPDTAKVFKHYQQVSASQELTPDREVALVECYGVVLEKLSASQKEASDHSLSLEDSVLDRFSFFYKETFPSF